jgi:hypothetical protein
MSSASPHRHPLQPAAAVVAVLFGLVTIAAGGRVLMGWSDPGYVVFRPLLIYNTTMGLAYVAAGLAIWRSLELGRKASAAIFVLNVIVLVAVVFLYASGTAVAIDSVRAMSFRTVVWLGLWLATGRMRPH